MRGLPNHSLHVSQPSLLTIRPTHQILYTEWSIEAHPLTSYFSVKLFLTTAVPPPTPFGYVSFLGGGGEIVMDKHTNKLIRRMMSSGMLRRVALVRTDVSEDLSASFIGMTRIGDLGTTLAVTSNQRTLRRNTK
jgi:hypothetical protein